MLTSKDSSAIFEDLYRHHGDRLWRALLAYTGDPEVASDALVEAFAQALRRGAQLHSPLSWIWRAAFRIAAGELKDRRGAAPLEEWNAVPPAPRTDDELLPALHRLSPNQRASIVLRYYAGYPIREVAALLGSTPGAVRVHLSVGKRRLRKLLGDVDV